MAVPPRLGQGAEIALRGDQGVHVADFIRCDWQAAHSGMRGEEVGQPAPLPPSGSSEQVQ